MSSISAISNKNELKRLFCFKINKKDPCYHIFISSINSLLSTKTGGSLIQKITKTKKNVSLVCSNDEEGWWVKFNRHPISIYYNPQSAPIYMLVDKKNQLQIEDDLSLETLNIVLLFHELVHIWNFIKTPKELFYKSILTSDNTYTDLEEKNTILGNQDFEGIFCENDLRKELVLYPRFSHFAADDNDFYTTALAIEDPRYKIGPLPKIEDSFTALTIAIENGFTDQARHILKNDDRLTFQDLKTALNQAIDKNENKIIEQILEKETKNCSPKELSRALEMALDKKEKNLVVQILKKCDWNSPKGRRMLKGKKKKLALQIFEEANLSSGSSI